MKSLILINSGEAGGAEKVASILSKKFNEEDVGLVFIKNNVFYDFNKNMKTFILHEKRTSLINLALKLKKIVSDNDILIVQSHMYRSNYINILAKLLGSKHKVQIVNCDCVSTKYVSGIKSFLSKILIKVLYPYADIVVAKSQAMLEDLKKYTKIKESTIIYNPIDIQKIEELSKVPSHIKLDGSQGDVKTIVNVGRFHSQKRQEDIIKALSELPSSYRLVLIGDGEQLSFCKNLASDLGVASRVVFTGKVKNPFSILKECDVFVMSSSCEGFPNALAEAMACGLPIISSDHLSGAREILSDCNNVTNIKSYEEKYSCESYGILYPVANVNELKLAIEHIFDDKIDYYKIRSRLRVEKYDISHSIEQYINLIDKGEVLNRHE